MTYTVNKIPHKVSDIFAITSLLGNSCTVAINDYIKYNASPDAFPDPAEISADHIKDLSRFDLGEYRTVAVKGFEMHIAYDVRLFKATVPTQTITECEDDQEAYEKLLDATLYDLSITGFADIDEAYAFARSAAKAETRDGQTAVCWAWVTSTVIEDDYYHLLVDKLPEDYLDEMHRKLGESFFETENFEPELIKE